MHASVQHPDIYSLTPLVNYESLYQVSESEVFE